MKRLDLSSHLSLNIGDIGPIIMAKTGTGRCIIVKIRKICEKTAFCGDDKFSIPLQSNEKMSIFHENCEKRLDFLQGSIYTPLLT